MVLLGVSIPAAAQAPPPSPPVTAPGVSIPRVSRPPMIDDFLQGVPREAEAEVTGFLQRVPGDGDPVSQPTTAYLSYDDRNLYVVFVCGEEPGQVRAHLSKRENISGDDLVGVYLDTFDDQRRSYVFLTNPLGIQSDAILTEGLGTDSSFDTVWHSEGRLTAEGYVVWMAIPFRSLRFSSNERQVWGITLTRSIVRNNEGAFWPYSTLRKQSFLEQMASMEGLERVSPGRNLQFIPYGLASGSRFLDFDRPAFRTEGDARAGLDAKIVLRDALTLDVALNPDFSQVESDEPQVTANQRFEVFFPEKRPFFIENASFFQTPVNLFFTRRIVDPQFGTRLTGKAGRWALGAMLIDDRAPGRLVSPGDPLRGERAAVGVVRVQREFAAQSTVGLFISSRDFAGTSNRMFSLDTRLKLGRNWVVTGQAARSYTTGVACVRCAGPTYYLEVRRGGRHFTYVGRYNDRSPDFRAQLGFIPRVDIRQTEQFAAYDWWPRGGRLLRLGPSVFTVVNWNRAGQVQDWFVDASFSFDFPGSTYLSFERFEAFELFGGVEFRKHRTNVSFTTDWKRWLGFSVGAVTGNNPNYFPATGAPFLGNLASTNAGITLRPSPRLRIENTYLYTRLGTREGSSPVGVAAGQSIFNNHIARAKVNYQFTRELSLRTIVDYNAVLSAPSLVALPRAKEFVYDFLLTYLLHPGTALYVGYTDRYENLDLASGMPPTVVRTLSPTTPTGRVIFVKLSYLFRY
jgi:hypothetical protein